MVMNESKEFIDGLKNELKSRNGTATFLDQVGSEIAAY